MNLLDYINRLHFYSPEWVWLFLTLPLGGLIYFLFTQKKYSSLSFSHSFFKTTLSSSWRQKLIRLPSILRILVLILLILTLMRPQKIVGLVKSKKDVIDIVLALDISQSMTAEDFSPNRLQIAKQTLKEFINQRPDDRIGLVVFGKESFLQCPLTLDHQLLKGFISRIDFLEKVSQNTAIGLALMTSILALKNSDVKNRIIILVTDGENNDGDIDPLTAAEIASKFNIKIYSIGIGKPGENVYYKTINDPFFGKRQIAITSVMDEASLKKISSITKGKYFNVQNAQKFKETYRQIDQMEKTQIEQEKLQKYEEQFPYFLKVILLLLLLEVFLKQTILKRNPS